MDFDLKNKVKKSLIWSFADQFFSQLIFLGFNIYLARMLSPEIFGIVALVTIFTNFATTFIDFGFGSALIHKQETDNDDFSTVFWFNLSVGLFLFIVFYLIAPILASFYDNHELKAITRVISIGFIFVSLSSIQSILLIKTLNFKKKIIINWVSILIGYFIAIALVWKGYGVWAIVIMNLSVIFFNTVAYWTTSKWRPKFVFRKSRLKALSSFGLNSMGDSSINYWARNYDNFIIGKVLGSSDLGIYTRAYSLMMLPLKNLTAVFTKVLFPAFSKIQDDIDLIQKNYLKVILLIASVSFPLMIGLSLVSKEFVLLFFGDNWVKMIPVLKLLSILGAVQSLVSLNGLIYNSLGKPHIAFRVTIFVNIILILTFTIGVKYGLLGITWSYFIVGTLISFPIYHIALKQIKLNLWDVFVKLKGIFFSVLIMYLGVSLLDFINFFTDMLLTLIVKIIIGLAFYFSAIFLFNKELLKYWLLIFKSQKFQL